MSKKKIRLIELFAGIGATAKALRNIGVNFEHYRVIEFDKYAIKSYNAIHGTNFKTQDITEITGSDLGIINSNQNLYIMSYTYPCQDLSTAGLQLGMKKNNNTRSGLLWEVERLLNETKELPQILLMENVTQVHGKKNIEDFNRWIKFLESKGYSNYWQDLNAKDYGTPQNRDRCFMVSKLNNTPYTFPNPVPLDKCLLDILEDKVADIFYLGEKTINLIKDNDGQLNTMKDKQVNRAVVTQVGNIIKTGNYSNPQRGRVYDPHGICPTLATVSGGGLQHKILTPDNRIRKLTPKEYWRLMNFSDEDYNKAKRVNFATQMYKQAGNSICVHVLEEIFKNLTEIH